MTIKKMINKEELDNILALYKAQPVGSGYIDIIVKRENVRQLIHKASFSVGFKSTALLGGNMLSKTPRAKAVMAWVALKATTMMDNGSQPWNNFCRR
ncbi:MAG: hypothetical protein R3E31_17205 [Chloroflexota bacterium]